MKESNSEHIFFDVHKTFVAIKEKILYLVLKKTF